MEEMRNGHNIFVRKPEGKRPLGSRKLRWEDNIRIDVIEIRWDHVDWLHTTQDREQWRALVNKVKDFRIP
jgi:hypothetical protein